MRIETQEVYYTDDGKLFFSQGEAERHEHRLKLLALLDNYIIYGNEISDMTGLISALLTWKENHENR